MYGNYSEIIDLLNTQGFLSEKGLSTSFNMSRAESKDIIKYLQTKNIISIFRRDQVFKAIQQRKRLAEVCSLNDLSTRLDHDSEKTAVISFYPYKGEKAYIPKSIPSFELCLINLDFIQIHEDAEKWFYQAKPMADFIDEWHKKGYHFICECMYGDSRSPAVAAAILEHYEGQGIDIFSDFRYRPNKMIYLTLMKALAEKDGLKNIDR
jgi:predicted protein tyrosine phosphatase